MKCFGTSTVHSTVAWAKMLIIHRDASQIRLL